MASWALFNRDETKQLREGEAVRHGSKVYRMCRDCKMPVRVNKWLIGGTHLCVPLTGKGL